jgi:hypothetical protein
MRLWERQFDAHCFPAGTENRTGPVSSPLPKYAPGAAATKGKGQRHMNMKKLIWLVVSGLLLNGLTIAQNTSPDESAAITKTALDYIEGWL